MIDESCKSVRFDPNTTGRLIEGGFYTTQSSENGAK